jgi:2'-5' RNA ligase
MSTAGANSRLFLALWPSPGLQAELAQWRDAWRLPRSASPVRTDKLHLTLHFLGAVASERVAELTEGLALPFDPFELTFGHAELWPHGIALLAPDAVPEALLDLHTTLGEAVRGLALATEERSYRPHVTLARRAAAACAPLQGPAIRWPVHEYALMESRPGQDGGYIALRRYPART